MESYLGQISRNLEENGKYAVFKSMEIQSTPVSPTMARNSVQYKVAAKKLVKQNEKMNEV